MRRRVVVPYLVPQWSEVYLGEVDEWLELESYNNLVNGRLPEIWETGGSRWKRHLAAKVRPSRPMANSDKLFTRTPFGLATGNKIKLRVAGQDRFVVALLVSSIGDK